MDLKSERKKCVANPSPFSMDERYHDLKKLLPIYNLNLFFQQSIPYSFWRTGLKMEYHYPASMSVANLLHNQAKQKDLSKEERKIRVDFTNPENFGTLQRVILNQDYERQATLDAVLDFASDILLRRGFFHEEFKEEKTQYRTRLAKLAFSGLGQELGYETYKQISLHFEKYVNGIIYLKRILKKPSIDSFISSGEISHGRSLQ